MLAVDWEPFVGVAAALIAVTIVVVVIAAPWRGVREEPALDDDVQARLMLGEDPEEIERDLEEEEDENAPVSDLHPSEDDAESWDALREDAAESTPRAE
jgi:hypothetical protein